MNCHDRAHGVYEGGSDYPHSSHHPLQTECACLRNAVERALYRACAYMIGAGRAYEFMLTGNFISAEEAMSLGFVSRVVERDMLMDTALEFARNMNGKNPAGLRLTKEAININAVFFLSRSDPFSMSFPLKA
ncbi:MAG TPA: enoyl-CoA hydratase-related protein [Desulfomonilia bacterium]|nr:enoyl-CoA hydratase-related protein [Desulfomonilia bacterium]